MSNKKSRTTVPGELKVGHIVKTEFGKGKITAIKGDIAKVLVGGNILEKKLPQLSHIKSSALHQSDPIVSSNVISMLQYDSTLSPRLRVSSSDDFSKEKRALKGFITEFYTDFHLKLSDDLTNLDQESQMDYIPYIMSSRLGDTSFRKQFCQNIEYCMTFGDAKDLVKIDAIRNAMSDYMLKHYPYRDLESHYILDLLTDKEQEAFRKFNLPDHTLRGKIYDAINYPLKSLIASEKFQTMLSMYTQDITFERSTQTGQYTLILHDRGLSIMHDFISFEDMLRLLSYDTVSIQVTGLDDRSDFILKWNLLDFDRESYRTSQSRVSGKNKEIVRRREGDYEGAKRREDARRHLELTDEQIDKAQNKLRIATQSLVTEK